MCLRPLSRLQWDHYLLPTEGFKSAPETWKCQRRNNEIEENIEIKLSLAYHLNTESLKRAFFHRQTWDSRISLSLACMFSCES